MGTASLTKHHFHDDLVFSFQCTRLLQREASFSTGYFYGFIVDRGRICVYIIIASFWLYSYSSFILNSFEGETGKYLNSF